MSVVSKERFFGNKKETASWWAKACPEKGTKPAQAEIVVPRNYWFLINHDKEPEVARSSPIWPLP